MGVRSQDRSAATRIGVAVAEYVAQRAAGLAWCGVCRRFLPSADVCSRQCRPCGIATKQARRAKVAARRGD